MKRTTIKELFKNTSSFEGQKTVIVGWIKTTRLSKTFGFIELNDGSFFNNAQIVFNEENLKNYDEIAKAKIGSALIVEGVVVATPQNSQPFEIIANNIFVEGESTDDFPLQKKRHSLEFLREIAYLRPRTNLFRAMFRLRSEAAYAIHKFFHDKNFVYVNTPIITGSDAEGAGEMFQVTTLDIEKLPRDEKGNIDYKQDFFGKETNLTVSGQLNVETFAMAFSNVYTFGPTFRAENSNTSRHAAEFWMLEPEIVFADLKDNMKLAEDMLKFVIQYLLDNCAEEMKFFDEFVEQGLIEKLNKLVHSEFKTITYTNAIELLEQEVKKGVKFEYPVRWGMDMQSEHERYITEKIFNCPVTVTDYPKEIKAFYMRQNEDNKTVAAMDMLVPGIGELIGGSQREERLEKLEKRLEELKLNKEDYWWYLNLRRFGSATHSGFGLGFDRFLMYVTGVSNIRDTQPFPRTTKNADY
ncbi:MAG: asparagine--tRNA ligase [Tenericutes bacterium HGW-Tenericutes-4]|nr:MAG: asparagine--tRNA ligase [Tenericutes bacterium HGW-Tenericutes-4]